MVLPGISYAGENDSVKRMDGVSVKSLASSADPAVKSSKNESGLTSLIVAVELNALKKGDFYIYRNEFGDYLLKVSDLNAMGLDEIKGLVTSIGGQNYLAIKSIQGFDVGFEEKTLTLKIAASPVLFKKTIIDLSSQRRKNVLRPENNSAFVNYRLGYSNMDSSLETYNFSTEIGARLSNNLLLSNFSHTRTETGTSSVRLMSSLTRDWRDDLTRLTIGDFFSFSGDLGSTMNLGGLSLSKRYAIDPYFIQRPTADLAGVVSTASEADIYLDGVHLRNVKLNPGGFELQNLNYYGGARDVRVVIKDTFGREQVINQDYYFTNAILGQGLHEYSYNIGVARQNFGFESNRYNHIGTSAFHRYGISDDLTLGFRAESLASVFNAGPQVFWRPGGGGVFNAGLSSSHAPGLGSGTASQLGYSYQQGNFNSRVLWRHFQQDYLTATDTSVVAQPKTNLSAGLSYGTRTIGFFGIDHTVNVQHNGNERRSTSLTYNKSLFNQLSLFATLAHVVMQTSSSDNTDNNLFVGLSYFFKNNTSLRLSHQENADTYTDTAQFTKNTPVGEGWGFRVRDDNIRSATQQTNLLDSYLQINAQPAIISASYQAAGGKESYQASVAGALAYVDGSVGVSRPIYDSFGLVKTGGLKGVQVLHNNQPIGNTNEDGELFIPNLGSYLDNQISINDTDIPIDYSLRSREVYVSPGWRSGAAIKFDIRRIQAVAGKLSIKYGDAKAPLVYSEVALFADAESKQTLVLLTGKNGEFYIEDIKPGLYNGSAAIAGKVCKFSFRVPQTNESFITLEETICE